MFDLLFASRACGYSTLQVSYTRGMSIISLICNVQRTSEILERVFRVLGAQDVNVKMMSQVH